jgi:hypothetical protein
MAADKDAALGPRDRGPPQSHLLHPLANEGPPTESRHVPVVAKTTEEAARHFGWLRYFAGADSEASSATTKKELRSKPTEAGGIAALRATRPLFPGGQRWVGGGRAAATLSPRSSTHPSVPAAGRSRGVDFELLVFVSRNQSIPHSVACFSWR